MPRGRQDGGLALGAHGAEEVDGLVVSVGQPHGHNDVSRPDVEGRMDEPRDVQLFNGHLTPLLYLGLILAILGVLYLHGRACSTRLKLYLGAQYPLRRELVVHGQHKAGDGYRGPVALGVALRGAVEAVVAIVLEAGYGLAIAP